MEYKLLALACGSMRLDLCYALFAGLLMAFESPGREWGLGLVSSIVFVERALALRG
jgi:hypothetical protein